MTSFSPRLSVTVSQPNPVCILDPALTFGDRGLHSLLLLQHLSSLVEFWVVREFWHILDNYICYLNPLSVEASALSTAPPESNITELDLRFDERALQAWDRLRLKTDLEKSNLCWLGDEVSQSWLPNWLKTTSSAEEIVTQYEWLARALESRIQLSTLQNPFIASFRDTAALAATLGSSSILTYQLAPDQPPPLVEQLTHWGLSGQRLPLHNAIMQIEHQLWQSLFVQAGIAKLLWSDSLRLAIVHITAPQAIRARLMLLHQEDTGTGNLEFADMDDAWDLTPETSQFAELQSTLWESAHCYWYPLAADYTAKKYESPAQPLQQVSFAN